MAKKKKPAKKKSPAKKRSLKKLVLAAVLSVALIVGGAKGGKYVYDGMPHYKAGQCLLDEKAGLMVAVTGVDKEKHLYQVVLIPLALGGILQIPATGEIRKVNGMGLKEVDCQTGEALEKASK